MTDKAKPLLAICAISLLCGAILGFCNPLHAGPGPIPFNPTFVSGSGSSGCNPNNQLCFNTTNSPYAAYVWNPSLAAWEQYGGGGSGSTCPSGVVTNQFLFADSSGNCAGNEFLLNDPATGQAHVPEPNFLLFGADGKIGEPSDGPFGALLAETFALSSIELNSDGDIDLLTNHDTANINILSGVSGHGGGTVTITGENEIDLVGPVTFDGDVTFSSPLPNSDLEFSSVTLAGTSVSLGGSISAATLTGDLNIFSNTLQGLSPASGGGTTNFLRADHSWAAPPSVTWPTSGSVVISSGTNIPTGVAEINGDVLVGSAGAWVAGTVPVASVSGGLCTSTASSVQYNNAGVAGCTSDTWDSANSVLTVANGSASHPAINFASGNTTGIYSATANEMDISFSGTKLFQWDVSKGLHKNAGAELAPVSPTSTAPSLIPTDTATNMGFGVSAAGTGISAIVSGVDVLEIKQTQIEAKVPVALHGYTVSALPVTPLTGSMAYVTDATVCTFLSAPAGGGSTFCPVIYNGATWIAN